MDSFGLRFKKEGGSLYSDLNIKEKELQIGGNGNLSPTSTNWKKKFLEVQSENDDLKIKIAKLEKKLKKLEPK